MNAGSDRIALFGGSFDPPHCAHLEIARAAVEHRGLSRVVFVPCRESPLKGRQPGASGAERLEMLRLAVNGLPWAEVSDWELSRPGPSYSWQTAEHFAKENPDCSLHWLMGADQWAILERWARPEFLRDTLTFIVFAREGTKPSPRQGWRAIFLPGEFPGSSTEARRRLAAGEYADGLLPPAVEEYAVRHSLYTPAGRR
jgi:nicotinate-nucleotide adenylyltransferase